MEQAVITIGRQYGSGGRIVAQKLAQRLGVPCYDKELIQKVAKDTGLSEQYLQELDRKPTNSFFYDLLFSAKDPALSDKVYIAQSQVIQDFADKGSCVILGRCADYVLRKIPERRLSVFICAPMEERIKRAREVYGVENVNMENFIQRQDRQRASYYNYFAMGKWGDGSNYDLCINSRIGLDEAVDVIAAALGEGGK